MNVNAPDKESRLEKFRIAMFAPVDIAGIVFFRIAFGLILFGEAVRYLYFGYVTEFFVAPDTHFNYPFFSWVVPLPGYGMYAVWIAIAVAAFCIAAGFLYRLAAAIFFVLFSYSFLIDRTLYLNHFYLVILVSFLLILVPAHRAYSIDARLRPSLRSLAIPAWGLWVLRLQIGVVYFFGGVHKINGDWLAGQPIRMMMDMGRHSVPVLGYYFRDEWMIAIFQYGGILLDLFIVPALLWRRTRPFAFAAAMAFHLLNMRIFDIGIFPWFMICATTLYLDPDWPRRFWSELRRRTYEPAPPKTAPESTGKATQWALLAFLIAYCAVQLLVPLRPYLYRDHMLWSDEATWFSWNMMLADKRGAVIYHIVDPETGEKWRVNPADRLRYFQKLTYFRTPDLIHEYALELAGEWREKGHDNVEIYVESIMGLNGRTPQAFIDPGCNLAAQPRILGPKPWVEPLAEPYPPRQPVDSIGPMLRMQYGTIESLVKKQSERSSE